LSSPHRRRRSATRERSTSPLWRRLRFEPLEDCVRIRTGETGKDAIG
jgi:hypothetical protein